MRNVDLTMNGDFTKGRSITLNLRSQGLVSAPIVKEERRTITNTEINTNFLTGSIKQINDSKHMLQIMRSIDNIEPICDRCGKPLLLKETCLCETCGRELEEEINEDRIMNLIKR